MTAEGLTIEMTATCTKAMIDWGDAIRAAEKAKDSQDVLVKSAAATPLVSSVEREEQVASWLDDVALFG